jgi:hypothetical protein
VAGDSALPAGEDHNGDTDAHAALGAVPAGWLTRFRIRNSL